MFLGKEPLEPARVRSRKGDTDESRDNRTGRGVATRTKGRHGISAYFFTACGIVMVHVQDRTYFFIRHTLQSATRTSHLDGRRLLSLATFYVLKG
jgi:hypothetical protein